MYFPVLLGQGPLELYHLVLALPPGYHIFFSPSLLGKTGDLVDPEKVKYLRVFNNRMVAGGIHCKYLL